MSGHFTLVAVSIALGFFLALFAAIEGPVMAAVNHVIVDLEFPRLGVIRVDDIDQVLVDARQAMN